MLLLGLRDVEDLKLPLYYSERTHVKDMDLTVAHFVFVICELWFRP